MQWHQLDHMQSICTLHQTDNHINTSSLNFYRPDALPHGQTTVSKHWRHTVLSTQWLANSCTTDNERWPPYNTPISWVYKYSNGKQYMYCSPQLHTYDNNFGLKAKVQSQSHIRVKSSNAICTSNETEFKKNGFCNICFFYLSRLHCMAYSDFPWRNMWCMQHLIVHDITIIRRVGGMWLAATALPPKCLQKHAKNIFFISAHSHICTEIK